MVIEDSTNGIIAVHVQIFCAAYKSEHSKMQKYDLAKITTDFSENLKNRELF
jgi:hypothetical protein